MSAAVNNREQYQKLPGHRRGILRGASLWIGSDHLLSVKSVRFREEYKRFYLRDVQAIVIAQGSRFHISTRAVAAGALWMLAYLFAGPRAPWIPTALWSAAVCLVGSWLYVSWARSCSCRIYTAVSSDDLPSIYRTWTARHFLEAVEPRIGQVQGVLEGAWAEAVENYIVGTSPPAAASTAPHTSLPAGAPPAPALPPTGRVYTTISNIFLASLFADGLLNLLTLHSMTRSTEWLGYSLSMVQVAAAVLVFLQYHRGVLQSGMQKVAIAALLAMGGTFYLRQVVAGIATQNQQRLPDPRILNMLPGYLVLREVDAGVCLLLGIIGVAFVVIRGSSDQQPGTIVG